MARGRKEAFIKEGQFKCDELTGAKIVNMSQ